MTSIKILTAMAALLIGASQLAMAQGTRKHCRAGRPEPA